MSQEVIQKQIVMLNELASNCGLSDEAKEALVRVEKAIIEAVEKIINWAKKILEATREAITSLIDAFWKQYRRMIKQAPPRITHLAFHHKKRRIRKKNWARLWGYA